MRKFEDLPREVQTDVLETLRAFNSVNVIFEYGEYHVSTGTCIKSHYGEDHEFLGTYRAVDLYTLEERDVNFERSFGYKRRGE